MNRLALYLEWKISIVKWKMLHVRHVFPHYIYAIHSFTVHSELVVVSTCVPSAIYVGATCQINLNFIQCTKYATSQSPMLNWTSFIDMAFHVLSTWKIKRKLIQTAMAIRKHINQMLVVIQQIYLKLNTSSKRIAWYAGKKTEWCMYAVMRVFRYICISLVIERQTYFD